MEREWLAEERDGFRLIEANLLLDNWSKNYLAERSTEHRFQSEKSVLELEMALTGICKRQVIPYALMGFSAAMRYDPMFQHDKLSAYVLSDLGQIVSELELTESKKGNVSLWTPYDEGVLRGAQEFLEIKVTSPVQTYLDLMAIGGKGEKVGHAIWQAFIKEKWSDKIEADAPLISYSSAAVPQTAAA
jgi:Transcriptional regulator, AbiEi antitoxin, Type IV TA system